MRSRIIAFLELVLILPAVLFMTALVLRNLEPLQYEPSRSAQRLVTWYAERMWTLWFLLLGLPLIVLASGCAELLRSYKRGIFRPFASQKLLSMARTHLSFLFIAATTLFAGIILAIVVLHVLAN